SSAARSSIERPLVERLHEADVVVDQQRREQAGDEAGVEVADVGVEEHDELTGSAGEPLPERLALPVTLAGHVRQDVGRREHRRRRSRGNRSAHTRSQCPDRVGGKAPFVESLRCRECARTYPAEALHVCEYCFGPLEVAYDYEAIAASVSREKIAAGPATIWR